VGRFFAEALHTHRAGQPFQSPKLGEFCSAVQSRQNCGKAEASGDDAGCELQHALPMRATKPERGSITPQTAEQATAVLTLDLVGLAEAAELAGIGRAAFSLRRSRHRNFPVPVAELRCGPVWFRWQIQSYLAEEWRLGRRGWYGRRVGSGR
jgi:hypothetical protein